MKEKAVAFEQLLKEKNRYVLDGVLWKEVWGVEEKF